MSVSLSRRLALLLAIGSISLAIMTCKSARSGRLPPSSRAFCEHGNNSRGFPLICVDDDTLKPDPETAYVYDVEPDENHHPTGNSVKIRWFSKRGGDFKIVPTSSSCFQTERPNCDNAGECWAKVKPLSGEKQRRCTVNIVGRKDPFQTIVINPCCL